MSEPTKILTAPIIVRGCDNDPRSRRTRAPRRSTGGFGRSQRRCWRRFGAPTVGYDVTGAAFPRRQHYVPKTLLKNFCDDDGWLAPVSSPGCLITL